MMLVTKAFCRLFLRDPISTLSHLERFVTTTSQRPNAAQLSFVYSGIGIGNYALGRFHPALRAYARALELGRQVGDDARVSIIEANLCTVLMHRGEYEESIRYGKMSVQHGEASGSSTLLLSYINLIDPYVLTGQEDQALECIQKARNWLSPERRWKLHCTFLLETASFALIQRNLGLALDLICQLEGIARGREDALPMPGPYWKLIAFRKTHLGHSDEAYEMAQSLANQWRRTYVLHYLDMAATMAWLELRDKGRITEETSKALEVFQVVGAKGKRALLILQGFLPAIEQLHPTTNTTSRTADSHLRDLTNLSRGR